MDRSWSRRVFDEHDLIFKFVRKKQREGKLTEVEFSQIYSEPLRALLAAAGHDVFFPDSSSSPVLSHATHVITTKLLNSHPEFAAELQAERARLR
jgi:hypothetical protein